VSVGYPASDYDRGYQLLQALGSYWTNIFQDNNKLREHLRSTGQMQGQVYLNTLEVTAYISRLTVPIFHTENWHLITFKRSDSLSLASIYRPDDLQYGPQDGSNPERAAGFIQTYAGTDNPGIVELALPDSMVDAPATLQNLVIYPSKTWVNGIDYEVDKVAKRIKFRDDPFTDPMVPRRDIYDSVGNIVDMEIALWVYRGRFDLKDIYSRFGQQIDIVLDSSEDYKKLVNAMWDMFVLGPAASSMTSYVAALTGVPLVVGPTETVEVVSADAYSQLMITSTKVYRVPFASTITVSVGDTVTAGQPICDAFSIEELSDANHDYSWLPAVGITKSLISGPYMAELQFKNTDVALEYLGLDGDGKAIVQFEIGGFPGDVEFFWEFVQAAGKLPGQKTLAELLDKRTNPVGQPGPLNLPLTINPMTFILDNLCKNNLFVIRVKPAAFNPSAPGLSLFSNLRKVIPPHTTYIVFVDMELQTEAVDLSQVGDENEPGAEEELSLFYGATAAMDEATEVGSATPGMASYGDVSVYARPISLTCA
jgi:hypothetical protein